LPSRTRVSLHTLGCPKNDADSGTLARRLRELGVAVADDPADATHIVVNTCGFIQDAKEESIAAILEAVSNYPGRDVLVMGCLVERYRDELAADIPEVAGWFRVGETDELIERLAGPGADARPAPMPRSGADGDADADVQTAADVAAPIQPQAYAYVKISDGCDYRCTFCAIPAIKGAYKAQTVAQIREQALAALDAGARELVLVGQDTAIWEHDRLDLPALIDLLAADDRVAWIRLLYLQPEHVTDRLLDFMASHPKMCRYLDLPFQHASTPVLRRMGRRGTAEEYLGLLGRARTLMPDVATRSTFIVGFPGEMRADMDRLLDFVERADLRYGGAFVYSAEEGTTAAELRPSVPIRTARRRLQRLTDVLFAVAAAQHERLVGTPVEVLIDAMVDAEGSEEVPEGVVAVGRSRGQAPEVDGVCFVMGGLPRGAGRGDIVQAEVTEALGYDLVVRCS
jgi:ribosomal protein S12 methylthiotransferase